MYYLKIVFRSFTINNQCYGSNIQAGFWDTKYPENFTRICEEKQGSFIPQGKRF
jgi:hypothetical protein